MTPRTVGLTATTTDGALRRGDRRVMIRQALPVRKRISRAPEPFHILAKELLGRDPSLLRDSLKIRTGRGSGATMAVCFSGNGVTVETCRRGGRPGRSLGAHS